MLHLMQCTYKCCEVLLRKANDNRTSGDDVLFCHLFIYLLIALVKEGRLNSKCLLNNKIF